MKIDTFIDSLKWGRSLVRSLWFTPGFFTWVDVECMVRKANTQKFSKRMRSARKTVIWLVEIGFLLIDPAKGFHVNRDFTPNSQIELYGTKKNV